MPHPTLESLGDVLAFAIRREVEAAQGYAEMAKRATTPGLRTLLLELEGQEKEHRRLLENVAAAGLPASPEPLAPDMGLSDALDDVPLDPDMTFQDLLIFAARKEKRAEDLYAGLARRPELAPHRRLFEFLAGQERTHKLKLETEYENRVLTED